MNCDGNRFDPQGLDARRCNAVGNCWGAQYFHPVIGLSSPLPSFCLPCASGWSSWRCLRRYLSLCPFGFIGFSSATSKSILHHILLSQTESNNLIACGHTCMSGLERAAAAILGLVAAVKSLAFKLGRARRQPSRQNRQTLVSGK